MIKLQASKIVGNNISAVESHHRDIAAYKLSSYHRLKEFRPAAVNASINFDDGPHKMNDDMSFKEKLAVSAARYKHRSRHKTFSIRRNDDVAYRINSKMRTPKRPRSVIQKTPKTYSHPQLNCDTDEEESNV